MGATASAAAPPLVLHRPTVGGYPISYAVDGRQYVAIGAGFSPEGFSLARATPEYKPATVNVLYVFALT